MYSNCFIACACLYFCDIIQACCVPFIYLEICLCIKLCTGVNVEAINLAINGCIIRSINPGEAIAKDGRLSVGDFIVTVNNETLRRATNAQARAIIRRASLLSIDVR